MRTLAQVEIDPKTAVNAIKMAKGVVKALKTSPDGGSSALECMELETETLYQVTTYRDGVATVRGCVFQRITPLQIKVETQLYGTSCLEVSWLAEGVFDNKSCIAKIITYATWKDGWYSWDTCEDNGTPKAPYAKIYTHML